MGKLKTVVVKYWKVYAAALVIAVICDLIGTVKLNIGIGTLTIFPMVFATIIGGILGPDAFKLFKVPESRLGGSLVLVVLAPFMAKMGVSAGASDMLTGITGIYMGTFVGLPLTRKLYAILEPRIGRIINKEAN